MTIVLIDLFWEKQVIFPVDDLSAVFSVSSSIIIYAANRFNFLQKGFRNRIISYFGRISYSFYLIHVPIGVNLLYYVEEHAKSNRFLIIIGTLLAFTFSVIGADLLNRFVEVPSMKISRRAKSWLKAN